MRSPAPMWHFQPQPPEEASGAPDAGMGFQGFKPLVANFLLLAMELVEQERPGLTDELRWTSIVAAKETLAEAYKRGSSPYEFQPIPWARWTALLHLSLSTAKIRLARLEELGLLEVEPGERGPAGTLPNRYRLRWADEGQAASRTLQAVLHDRMRRMSRDPQAGAGVDPQTGIPGDRQTDPPGGRQTGPTGTDGPVPHGDRRTGPPAVEGTETSTSVLSQSVSPSETELNGLKKLTDGLMELIAFNNKNKKVNQSVSPSVSVGQLINKETDMNTSAGHESEPIDHVFNLDFGLKTLLKAADPKPWPEILRIELGKILERMQVAVIEERSPWSARGAWAILQAIRLLGRNLRNQAGTLWNALLQEEKGARWLAMTGGPFPDPGGGDPSPEHGSALMAPSHEPQEEPARRCGDGPLSRQRGATEEGAPHHAVALDGEDEQTPFPGEEDAQAGEATMTQPHVEPMTRPEELSPEVKAELRTSIETFRNVTRAALRSPAANRPGGYDDFTRCWKHIVEVLEPMLPLQINLPDEYRPVAIRQSSQIKMNVVEAVYRAVS